MSFRAQPPMFESEVSERLAAPGVAVGLAWTALGGEIMYVEASRMEGEGRLTLTGQLGDVMKESANLALNWVRSNGDKVPHRCASLFNDVRRRCGGAVQNLLSCPFFMGDSWP